MRSKTSSTETCPDYSEVRVQSTFGWFLVTLTPKSAPQLRKSGIRKADLLFQLSSGCLIQALFHNQLFRKNKTFATESDIPSPGVPFRLHTAGLRLTMSPSIISGMIQSRIVDRSGQRMRTHAKLWSEHGSVCV